MNKIVTAAVVSSLFVAACAGSAAPETADHNASAVRASEPAADISGTWRFDLDASDVAGAIKQDCAQKADPKACWNEIAAEAKLEKVRFATENGRTVWSSFAQEGNKEILFVKIPVDLSADGTGHVLAKVAGPASGPHADRFAKASINQLRVEVVDAKTIAMNDPKKGRLVYSKE